MEKEGISALYFATMMWAKGRGAQRLNETAGLWVGQTERRSLGPFTVKINGHNESVDFVPPFHVVIENGGIIPIALVGPQGGQMLVSNPHGEDEAALIEHFQEQTPSSAPPSGK